MPLQERGLHPLNLVFQRLRLLYNCADYNEIVVRHKEVNGNRTSGEHRLMDKERPHQEVLEKERGKEKGKTGSVDHRWARVLFVSLGLGETMVGYELPPEARARGWDSSESSSCCCGL